MCPSFCHFPDEPCLHCAEKKFLTFCTFSGSGDIVQYPFDLCGGKISVDYKTRFLTKFFRKTFFFQRIAVFGSAAALPDDGVIDRFSCFSVPYDSGFSLVCNTDRRDIFCRCTDLVHCFYGNSELTGPYFVGIVLYPSGMRKILGEFSLGDAAHLPLFIEKDASVACRSGIHSHDIF